jgi:hypothetical protein
MENAVRKEEEEQNLRRARPNSSSPTSPKKEHLALALLSAIS